MDDVIELETVVDCDEPLAETFDELYPVVDDVAVVVVVVDDSLQPRQLEQQLAS